MFLIHLEIKSLALKVAFVKKKIARKGQTTLVCLPGRCYSYDLCHHPERDECECAAWQIPLENTPPSKVLMKY